MGQRMSVRKKCMRVKAHVVVVANAAPVIQTELAKAKDITDFIETTINLSDETLTKGLTMSSKVLDVTLVANTTNYIGYDDEVGDITVKAFLVRKFMAQARFPWFEMSLRSLWLVQT